MGLHAVSLGANHLWGPGSWAWVSSAVQQGAQLICVTTRRGHVLAGNSYTSTFPFIFSASQWWERIVCLLFYTIATIFQLYHGGNMVYELRRKPEPSLLPTQGTFNHPHNIVMIWDELAFGDTVSYTQQGHGWYFCSTATCYGGDRMCTPVNRVTNPMP